MPFNKAVFIFAQFALMAASDNAGGNCSDLVHASERDIGQKGMLQRKERYEASVALNFEEVAEKVPATRAPERYKAAAKGTNSCPAGFVTTLNELNCKAAANDLYPGAYEKEQTETWLPGGCFVTDAGKVYYNDQDTGGSQTPGYTKICMTGNPMNSPWIGLDDANCHLVWGSCEYETPDGVHVPKKDKYCEYNWGKAMCEVDHAAQFKEASRPVDYSALSAYGWQLVASNTYCSGKNIMLEDGLDVAACQYAAAAKNCDYVFTNAPKGKDVEPIVRGAEQQYKKSGRITCFCGKGDCDEQASGNWNHMVYKYSR